MLFLGNEKYPEENVYQKYVEEHGGQTNAFTTNEDTNYHFDIMPEFVEGALDRFAQFFVSPTFTQSATDREMNAVHAEFEKFKNEDSWRLQQFFQSIVNPEHPYYRFGIGSLRHLRDVPSEKNIDLRGALLDFHQKFYSANMMKLVILGKESLDELPGMVTKIFSPIKNNNRSREFPGFGKHKAFPNEKFPMWYHVVPQSDIHNLCLYWPLNSLQHRWREKPERYLAHLLGHEADGSLFALLKKKGWAVQLVAGTTLRVTDEFDVFSCVVALTEDGMSKS